MWSATIRIVMEVHAPKPANRKPYGVGPRLSVKGAKLSAPGAKTIDLPTGEWIHVEMTAGLGNDAGRTWDFVITLPSKKPLRFEKLPQPRNGIKELQWLGFCSTANHKTALLLDNIELTNTKVKE